ncbi:MAG: ATP:cob(I)alamin adenosyltransferase [Erysipelotrichaceae bacterium]
MITSKKGDQGMTSLKDERVSKFDCRIDSLGNLDETMAAIIYLQSQIDSIYEEELRAIVVDLTSICSLIAKYPSELDESRLLWLEAKIKEYEDFNESFHFSYPFNQPKNALCNMVRSIVRRSERSLLNTKVINHEIVIAYMNRLSDYFFVLSKQKL